MHFGDGLCDFNLGLPLSLTTPKVPSKTLNETERTKMAHNRVNLSLHVPVTKPGLGLQTKVGTS